MAAALGKACFVFVSIHVVMLVAILLLLG